MAFAAGFWTKRMKSACVRRIGTKRGDPDSPVVPWQDAHLKAAVNDVLPRSTLPVRFRADSCACLPVIIAVSIITTIRDNAATFISTSLSRLRNDVHERRFAGTHTRQSPLDGWSKLVRICDRTLSVQAVTL